MILLCAYSNVLLGVFFFSLCSFNRVIAVVSSRLSYYWARELSRLRLLATLPVPIWLPSHGVSLKLKEKKKKSVIPIIFVPLLYHLIGRSLAGHRVGSREKLMVTFLLL